MKRVAVITIFLPMVAMLMAQTTRRNSDAAEKQKAAEELSSADVREAVLRYQISRWTLVTSGYCVRVEGKDADQALLKRLQPLPVREASGCRKQGLPGLPESIYTIVNTATGKNSVIFDVGKIRWTKPNKADVEGGYQTGSQVNGNGTYVVERDGTHWTVTSFDEHGASVTTH